MHYEFWMYYSCGRGTTAQGCGLFPLSPWCSLLHEQNPALFSLHCLVSTCKSENLPPSPTRPPALLFIHSPRLCKGSASERGRNCWLGSSTFTANCLLCSMMWFENLNYETSMIREALLASRLPSDPQQTCSVQILLHLLCAALWKGSTHTHYPKLFHQIVTQAGRPWQYQQLLMDSSVTSWSKIMADSDKFAPSSCCLSKTESRLSAMVSTSAHIWWNRSFQSWLYGPL